VVVDAVLRLRVPVGLDHDGVGAGPGQADAGVRWRGGARGLRASFVPVPAATGGGKSKEVVSKGMKQSRLT
jgi:hypothetical protein